MSDKYSVIYSSAALDDLESIYSHIAFKLQAPQTALNQVNRIREGIRRLDTFPEGFSIVDWEPWKSYGMHKLPIDNYVVYYLVNKSALTVTIIRIFYNGRDIKNIINPDAK